ncbi:MAG: hypothetical protein FIA89_07090 [Geobacter sp.]|nr:hypothetical protein [Geobacter sp.]
MTLMTLRAFMVSGLIFAWVSVVSSEAINVTSPGPGFFENVVLDSLLLMDGELQQTLAADIAYLVKTAHFTPQANSWIPKPHPKGRLLNIYNSLNTGNLKDSFTSMVAPVVEMACMSQQYDPMNDSSSKCVSRILKYPIIETIQINYSYIQGQQCPVRKLHWPDCSLNNE